MNSNKPTMIIMRGLPGSGKSTFARRLVENTNGTVFSSDDYFMVNGNYLYDPSQIRAAHLWNQARTKEAMEQRVSPLVIDNTNTRAWEPKEYVNFADHYGYQAFVVTPHGPYDIPADILATRNSHGVPLEKIFEMQKRFDLNVTVEQIRKSRYPWEEASE